MDIEGVCKFGDKVLVSSCFGTEMVLNISYDDFVAGFIQIRSGEKIQEVFSTLSAYEREFLLLGLDLI